MPPTFPTLAGQAWSVHKRPTFSTRVASHMSGRDVRAANFVYPQWEFEVSYDVLAASNAANLAGAGATSLQTLLGFYLQCQGQFATFLYVDPSDNAVTGQAIGTGDGSKTSWPLARTLGGFTEPVGWATALAAAYVRGTAASASLSQPNTLVFAAAPAAGAAITADFSFAFLCRFLDDQEDFENIMNGLWQLGSLKFRSVRA